MNHRFVPFGVNLVIFLAKTGNSGTVERQTGIDWPNATLTRESGLIITVTRKQLLKRNQIHTFTDLVLIHVNKTKKS